MNLEEYRKKVANLSVNEQKLRDLYLRDLALGKVQGPPTGYASLDKPWLKWYNEDSLNKSFPTMKMYDYIYEQNKNNLEFTALNYFGRKITYRELFDNIEKTAKSFLKLGIKEGDYVVISMPTTPESVYMLFALNRIGAVAVELDPRTTSNDIETTISESKAKLYITMEDASPLIDEIMKNNNDIDKQLKNVMLVSPTESLPFGINYLSNFKDFIDRKKGVKPTLPKNAKYLNWKQFMKKGNEYNGVIDVEYMPNQVAEIIYSSGTTSSPKPIQYTNETFTSMVKQIELVENDYASRDKNLDIIPLFLGFGSTNGVFTILAFGMEDILIPFPVIEQLPELMEKYKPNHILGAPIHMNVLLNYLKDNPNKLKNMSFLKSLVCGSAHLDSSKQYALDEELAKRGCLIKTGPGYGQNEAGPVLSFSTDSFLKLIKPGCSGFPLTFTTVSIFDSDTDEELQYGRELEGEIRYKTPSSMKGYAFNREKETSNYYRYGKDGTIWACSGDMGKMDNDGGIYVTDRITRQICHSGFKFSPVEIEELVTNKIPEIEACALVSKPDDVEENIPILYYSIKNAYKDESHSVKEKVILLCSTLKEYKIPKEYIEKEELPLTPNLKIDFKKLEREAKENDRVYVKKI